MFREGKSGLKILLREGMGSLAAKRKSLKGEFICGSNVVRARWNKGESVQHKRRGYISVEKISIPGIM